MPKQRPHPETLLQRAQEEERKKKRGKLKIYLGAAPGVGKTYTMIQDSIAKHTEGLDVVAGIVESHGRAEIESLLKNLAILPRQRVDYHGKELSEFDLDAALKRNPTLILVDEMAHTNAPGLRHAKRWQDIKELLDRGIDVYTTLNVQHIESLSDHVAQIIHAPNKETVPDSMLEIADTIELIDLPPDDLLKRLQEGKIYIPKQAELAFDNFFRKGNLIALRELALRTTANHVGAEVLLYRQGQGIKHIWPTKDKILVCIGPGIESLKLIRSAKRLASSLKLDWMAVYVDTPKLHSSEEQRNAAIRNLRLASQLGAQTRVLTGFDVVKEIMNFAREENVTQIMIWKHIQTRLRDLFFRNYADEMVRQSCEIDIYIMTGEREEPKPHQTISSKHFIPWKVYGISIGITALATAIDSLLYPFLNASNLIMVYLLGVTIIALFGQTGPSILASLLSVLLYGLCFVEPFYTFDISNIQFLFTLLVMLLVTQVISHLTILTRRQAIAARQTERQTSILYTLSHQLAATRGVDKLLQIGVRYLAEIFDSEVIALLPKNNHLEIRSQHRTEKMLDPKELNVAQWVYDLGQVAGLGTDTLPFSDALYVPLLASQGTIGVLRIHPTRIEHLFSPDQMRLLESCANQIALAIEVDRLQEKTKLSEIQTEADHARNTLLQFVSHDLRAPLASIIGAASTEIERAKELDAKTIKKLGTAIYLEAEQLSRLINNLLQLANLETGTLNLHKQPGSLDDIINLIINTSTKKLGKRTVHLAIPKDLPKVHFDHTLIQEVLINLLDNAIKFTPPESPIHITIATKKDEMIINIKDHGSGIMPDEINKLFTKFYRGQLSQHERGLGLGLAICNGIIKAHGGKIWAENRKEGGMTFCFTLPLETSDLQSIDQKK